MCQLPGSANAARGTPAAAAVRTQRPNAAREGKSGRLSSAPQRNRNPTECRTGGGGGGGWGTHRPTSPEVELGCRSVHSGTHSVDQPTLADLADFEGCETASICRTASVGSLDSADCIALPPRPDMGRSVDSVLLDLPPASEDGGLLSSRRGTWTLAPAPKTVSFHHLLESPPAQLSPVQVAQDAHPLAPVADVPGTVAENALRSGAAPSRPPTLAPSLPSIALSPTVARVTSVVAYGSFWLGLVGLHSASPKRHPSHCPLGSQVWQSPGVAAGCVLFEICLSALCRALLWSHDRGQPRNYRGLPHNYRVHPRAISAMGSPRARGRPGQPPGGAIRTLTLFFFYDGIHSLMFGGYPPTAIGYTPTAIGYTPTAIVGRIGHSEFLFPSLRHPLSPTDHHPRV